VLAYFDALLEEYVSGSSQRHDAEDDVVSATSNRWVQAATSVLALFRVVQ